MLWVYFAPRRQCVQRSASYLMLLGGSIGYLPLTTMMMAFRRPVDGLHYRTSVFRIRVSRCRPGGNSTSIHVLLRGNSEYSKYATQYIYIQRIGHCQQIRCWQKKRDRSNLSSRFPFRLLSGKEAKEAKSMCNQASPTVGRLQCIPQDSSSTFDIDSLGIGRDARGTSCCRFESAEQEDGQHTASRGGLATISAMETNLLVMNLGDDGSAELERL
ncbi:hypothetical protein M440DRAFT_1078238 [Trichoderma longibrachiatum ATCC 18648]|uniref:Uncharacterized protein n=1 Tax=Trichoderma longibrachiatum ATCC 18648 TaxID=983965 RepID=A0A2T4BVF7_TRILO|nr:hypothetical protein M440DRAFT_1078238 [Trichoderma longibrachiatum ATCC 18648]